MTAMHLSRTHAPCRDHRAWVVPILLAASALAAAAQSDEQPTITAVHKVQELTFNYRSSSQFYSCHDLEKRVAAFLIAIGARDDISVSARNCEGVMLSSGNASFDLEPAYGRDSEDPFGRGRSTDPFGRDRNDPWARAGYRRNTEQEQSAQVRIKLMMPVEVTPKILEEIEKDKSRRELISRVTGDPTASMNDPIVFAARRHEVTLSHSTMRLKAEDCNLLQQLTQQVIRRLDVKIKHQSFGCGPRSSSRIPPQLTVETWLPTGALLPMPNFDKNKKTPAASGSTNPQGEAGAVENPAQPDNSESPQH
jgi:hypothetical protein